MNHLPPKTIDDIAVITVRGPWKSKSGGNLDVLFSLPQDRLQDFLDFDNPAFDEIPGNMRGLRSYTVGDIPRGSIGANEWHKARTEYVTALSGSALWQCIDVYGNEREFVLDGKTSILMPPNILHTYKALEDSTRLLVISNTLFIPEDPLTHDTYSKDTFITSPESHARSSDKKTGK